MGGDSYKMKRLMKDLIEILKGIVPAILIAWVLTTFLIANAVVPTALIYRMVLLFI